MLLRGSQSSNFNVVCYTYSFLIFAYFAITFLVPLVSKAISSRASFAIAVTLRTVPSPNILWIMRSPALKSSSASELLSRLRSYLQTLSFKILVIIVSIVLISVVLVNTYPVLRTQELIVDSIRSDMLPGTRHIAVSCRQVKAPVFKTKTGYE